MPEKTATVAVSGGYAKPEDRYGKVIIAGRAQTGKTSLARKLSEATGLTVLKTCTTRPRRHPDEDTYHFYTPEEAAQVPQDQKLFLTLAVDGYERWTDRSDFLDAGIAVLDPTGIGPAIRIWQSQGYRVTIIYCGLPEEERQARWMKAIAKDDGSDWYEVLDAFRHREQTEKPMFDCLEDAIRQLNEMDNADALLYPNFEPERRTVCNEDRLMSYEPFTPAHQDGVIRNFMTGLAAGDLPGKTDQYRLFPSRSDLVLVPEDWTWDQWRTLCRAFDLLPECTCQIIVTKPAVKAFPGDVCDYDFKEGE